MTCVACAKRRCILLAQTIIKIFFLSTINTAHTEKKLIDNFIKIPIYYNVHKILILNDMTHIYDLTSRIANRFVISK